MSRDDNAATNMAIWVRHVLLFGRAQPSLTFVEDEPTFVSSDPLEAVWHWRRNVALQRSVAHVVLGTIGPMQVTTYVSRWFCSYLTSYINCETECRCLEQNRRALSTDHVGQLSTPMRQRFHIVLCIICFTCFPAAGAHSVLFSAASLVLSFADPPSSRRLDLFSSLFAISLPSFCVSHNHIIVNGWFPCIGGPASAE